MKGYKGGRRGPGKMQGKLTEDLIQEKLYEF